MPGRGNLGRTSQPLTMTATTLEISRKPQVFPPEERAALEPLIREIEQLKQERRALITAHNYMTPDIYYGVADLVGDSLALARMAARSDAEVILMAGVHFMAETSKIINPEATVLIPDLRAGCSLAEGITASDVRRLKGAYPGAPVVSYVNTTAEVKAESDICCTSGNAVAVVESLGAERVIFLPDGFLGRYVAAHTDVEIILWEGRCIVHERFEGAELEELREMFPDTPVIAHPECAPEVLDQADYVGSTHGIVNWVRDLRPAQVMMLTECSMADNVAYELDDVEIVRPCNLCPHMKKITLENIRNSLATMTHEVVLPSDIADRARLAVERMLAVGRN